MIDELQLGFLINKCRHKKTFSPNLKNGDFIIVISDKATQMGTHWVLLCNRNNKFFFADPLGLALSNYPHVRDRLYFADLGVTEIIQAPLQNLNSNLCGLYCIYITHYVFGANFRLIPYISEQELMRFVKHFIQGCCCLIHVFLFIIFFSKRKKASLN